MDPYPRSWARALAAYLIDDDGTSAGEYAMILTVLAGCVIMILHVLGRRMDRVVEFAANYLVR